jgi:hypothetical protein
MIEPFPRRELSTVPIQRCSWGTAPEPSPWVLMTAYRPARTAVRQARWRIRWDGFCLRWCSS